MKTAKLHTLLLALFTRVVVGYNDYMLTSIDFKPNFSWTLWSIVIALELSLPPIFIGQGIKLGCLNIYS